MSVPYLPPPPVGADPSSYVWVDWQNKLTQVVAYLNTLLIDVDASAAAAQQAADDAQDAADAAQAVADEANDLSGYAEDFIGASFTNTATEIVALGGITEPAGNYEALVIFNGEMTKATGLAESGITFQFEADLDGIGWTAIGTTAGPFTMEDTTGYSNTLVRPVTVVRRFTQAVSAAEILDLRIVATGAAAISQSAAGVLYVKFYR